ncbi:helix-turn-helix domain-containing protein [Acetobacterium fimetarium]|uniref:Helix-turn-helix domain-containing protein n=1 Tax=Acetobacterium fimetarium TaxID=52691 RepID=A0ABR6WRD4_9FIRM|nr:helix-turn-helix transcriptional regulator [Acetobacterium fimetarium]MBC3803085.1 helix-turn-helix domain-containing protein [Acetobacterium fimetarium]
MEKEKAFSTQQVAEILHVSKSTIYKLIHQEEINYYKIGRKIRFTQEDIDTYIDKARNQQDGFLKKSFANEELIFNGLQSERSFVISGQDLILDVLSNYLRLNGIPALRAYIGSFESLLSLYHDRVQVASCHLWDSDLDEYNVSYVRSFLPGIPCIIVHLIGRRQGFYVKQGNPKKIKGWADLAREDISIINREKGAGSRVLLDEQLRLLGLDSDAVNGYQNETSSHLTVASAVGRGEVDVGVGNEKIARQVDNIEFLPMQKEHYDLVIKKSLWNTPEVKTMFKIIRSNEFKKEFDKIGGYDASRMGQIVMET